MGKGRDYETRTEVWAGRGERHWGWKGAVLARTGGVDLVRLGLEGGLGEPAQGGVWLGVLAYAGGGSLV